MTSPLSFNQTLFTIRNAFPTPVIIAPVNEAAELNQTLLPMVLERAASVPGVLRSNDGGWQSADDFSTWSGDAGARLLAAAIALASNLTAVQGADGLQRRAPDWKVNAWANLNGAGHANAPHHHPGCFWSGVYWIDAGDPGCGGEFEMQDPRGILPGFAAPSLRYAVPGCLSAGGADFIVPEAGTLLLFPSWLVHAVRRYTGVRPRLSIAFNLAP